MATRPSRYRATLRKLKNNRSPEDKINDFLLDNLSRSILSGNKVHTNIISRAFRILFPRLDYLLIDTTITALWKARRFKEAIRVYVKAGRPFEHSETIGRYYERKGLPKRAMREFEHLMAAFSKISKTFLPFPRGPRQLYQLGKWYATKDKAKARNFLTLYLSSEMKWKGDPAFYLRHKNEARRLLDSLGRSGVCQ